MDISGMRSGEGKHSANPPARRNCPGWIACWFFSPVRRRFRLASFRVGCADRTERDGRGQKPILPSARWIIWKTICMRSFLFRRWPKHFIQKAAIFSGRFMMQQGILLFGFTGKCESEKHAICWKTRMSLLPGLLLRLVFQRRRCFQECLRRCAVCRRANTEEKVVTLLT